MSKIQWEYDLAEKPFREQLQAMGWQWIEGDTDVPELSERVNFREVLLKGRLEAALKRINLRDGEPWLDETRAAAEELAALGAEQGDRPGTPLFFRKPEQRPPDLRGKERATLQSQQILAAGMLRPAHLLDLMRNFSVFQQVDGKTRKVAARYHIIGFTNQNPSCARKMSERLEEILQRFKDDAVALERAVPDCHERKLALVQHAKECLVLGLSIE